MYRNVRRHVRALALLTGMLAGCSHTHTSLLAIGRDAERDSGRYIGGGTHFGRSRDMLPAPTASAGSQSDEPVSTAPHDATALPVTRWVLPREGMWARDYAGLDVRHVIEMRYARRAAHGDGFGSY